MSLWVFRIPPGYLLVEYGGLGVDGVWYAIALSQVVTPVVAGLWFLRGTWTDNVVDPDGPPGPVSADAVSDEEGDDGGSPAVDD
jgi:hypothetical protein